MLFGLLVWSGLGPIKAQSFKLGIGGGMNLSTMLNREDGFDQSSNYQSLTGWHAGLFLGRHFSERLALEGEVFFTRKGFKIQQGVSGGTLSYIDELYYLDIPIRVRYSIPLGEGLFFYGTAGPYTSYGVDATRIAKVRYNNGDTEVSKVDIPLGNNERDDQYRPWGYGLSLGTGISISNTIEVGSYFDLGLANISSFRGNERVVKNRVVRFSLRYMLF